MPLKIITCAAGFEVPAKGYCEICGSKPGEKCLKRRNDKRAERAMQRAKEIADRAERSADTRRKPSTRDRLVSPKSTLDTDETK